MAKGERITVPCGRDESYLVFMGYEFKEYVKKPIKIRAVRVNHQFTVKTKERTMKGKKGDYLIRGIEGEFYPCDARIFRKTYAKVKSGWKNLDTPTHRIRCKTIQRQAL